MFQISLISPRISKNAALCKLSIFHRIQSQGKHFLVVCKLFALCCSFSQPLFYCFSLFENTVSVFLACHVLPHFQVVSILVHEIMRRNLRFVVSVIFVLFRLSQLFLRQNQLFLRCFLSCFFLSVSFFNLSYFALKILDER